MALARHLQRVLAFGVVASLSAGCAIESATRGCACDPDRFHGAAGIDIPTGPSEPSWWIDPIIDHDNDDDDNQEEHVIPAEPAPQILRVTVPSDTLFDVGSSDITPMAEAALQGVHASLNGNVILDMTLDCHADSTGDTTSNQTLSEARATSLGTWIASHWNVPADRITRRGHGETQPIASNDTPTGRAQNRRCTISLALQRPT